MDPVLSDAHFEAAERALRGMYVSPSRRNVWGATENIRLAVAYAIREAEQRGVERGVEAVVKAIDAAADHLKRTSV